MNSVSQVSQRLLQVAGCPRETHTILEENVTTLLSQFRPEFVDSLQALPDHKLMEGLNGTYANGPLHLAVKLSRDIRWKPYSDQQVHDRIEALDREFKDTSREIVEASAPYPCRFILAGSILRGRFGAHSDLDVLCLASPKWMKDHAWSSNHETVSYQYLDCKPQDQPAMIAAFGPTREVTPEQIQQPGFLRNLYEGALMERGLSLQDGHLQGQPGPRPSEELPESGAIMWAPPMV